MELGLPSLSERTTRYSETVFEISIFFPDFLHRIDFESWNRLVQPCSPDNILSIRGQLRNFWSRLLTKAFSKVCLPLSSYLQPFHVEVDVEVHNGSVQRVEQVHIALGSESRFILPSHHCDLVRQRSRTMFFDRFEKYPLFRPTVLHQPPELPDRPSIFLCTTSSLIKMLLRRRSPSPTGKSYLQSAERDRCFSALTDRISPFPSRQIKQFLSSSTPRSLLHPQPFQKPTLGHFSDYSVSSSSKDRGVFCLLIRTYRRDFC